MILFNFLYQVHIYMYFFIFFKIFFYHYIKIKPFKLIIQYLFWSVNQKKLHYHSFYQFNLMNLLNHQFYLQ